MKRWLIGIGLTLLAVAAIGLRYAYVKNFPLVADAVGAPPASPAVLGVFEGDPPVVTVADWETRRAPKLRAAFAENVYGPMPPKLPGQVLARTALQGDLLAEGVGLEQLTVGFGQAGDRGKVNVVLARPAPGTPVRGLIVMQTFCGNAVGMGARFRRVRSLAETPGFCGGPMGWASHIILGRYPNAPPWKTVTGRGYAVAMVYAGDLVPDDRRLSGPALARLHGPGVPTGGALAAWAWLYSALGETLTREPGLTGAPVIAWGHSRNGKSALLAGATDPGIAAVIAHQSGRGGAALGRSAVGETIGQITGSYPFWFSPKYATFAGREAAMPIDQHQLIALIAPRPVLLGAGDRDRWGDPAGAFRAARGAAPVYRLYGAPGLDQTRLMEPDLTRPLATFMRQGTHGVTTRDWDDFLTFLDANLPPAGVGSPPPPGKP
jgi:hypothetical protein